MFINLFLFFSIMYTPINLNHKLRLLTEKVHDKPFHNLLTAKLISTEFTVSKPLPENSLSFCHF